MAEYVAWRADSSTSRSSARSATRAVVVGARPDGDTAKIAKATGGSIVKFDCSG
jgi:hypothetical protein